MATQNSYVDAEQVKDSLPVYTRVSKIWDFKTPSNAGLQSEMGYSTYNRTERPPSSGDGSTSGKIEWQMNIPTYWKSDPRIQISASFAIVISSATEADIDALVASGKGIALDRLGLSTAALNSRITSATVIAGAGQEFSQSALQDFLPLQLSRMDPITLAYNTPCSRLDDYTKFKNSANNDPLKGGINVISARDSRGIDNGYKITSLALSAKSGAGPWSTTLSFNLVDYHEALMIAPFQFLVDPASRNPFSKVQNFQVNITYEDLAKMINFNDINLQGTAAVSSVSVSNVTHRLITHEMTPNLQLSVPPVRLYNYEEYKQITSVSNSAYTSGDWFLGSQACNTIPHLWALSIQSKGARNSWQPRLNGALSSVNLTIGNSVDKFRDYDIQDLYEITAKRGYVQRFSTWAGLSADSTATADPGRGVGGAFFFAPADFSAPPDVIPLNNVSVDISGTITLSEAGNYKAQIFGVYNRLLTIKGDAWEKSTETKSFAELLGAQTYFVDDHAMTQRMMGGAGWLDGVGSFFSKLINNPLTKGLVNLGRNTIGKPWLGDDTAIGRFAKSQGYGSAGGADVTMTGGELTKVAGGASARIEDLMSQMRGF